MGKRKSGKWLGKIRERVRESQGNLSYLGPSSSTVRLQLRGNETKVRESQGKGREWQGKVREIYLT